MKKNLVTKKDREKYNYYFLPFIESAFTLKHWHHQDLIVNQQALAKYFEVNDHTIADWLKQMELDGLIIFDRKVKKFDDKVVANAMKKYILPMTDSPIYYSKLQEYINEYMLWTPTQGERIELYNTYLEKVVDNTKSIAQLEKEERAKAYEKVYPWTKDIMEKINTTRPDNLKSKYLSDGRLRETNFLCTTLNPEKEHDVKLFANDLNYRYLVLNEFFGTDKIIECDTNGSIYRLSYNLNHDELLADDVDIYTEFWKTAGFKAELTKVNRDALKLICMVIFMSNGTKNGYNSTLVYKEEKFLSRSEYFRKCALNNFCRQTGLDARTFLDTLTEAMYKVLGTDHFLEAEIFIHESNLHLLLLNRFQDEGIQAINVYDGFYFIEGTMTNDKYNQYYRDATEILKKSKCFLI